MKKNIGNKTRFYLSALLFGLGSLMCQSVFAKAGDVVFVLGKVEVTGKSGQISSLKKGMVVNSGDRLTTGIKGQVMLRMTDDSTLNLRPSSTVVISNYVYRKSKKTDRAHYELIAGTLRSITGKIGKSNKAAFELKMPVGTMGIRGTDFVARYCSENCGDTPGFFVDVNSGGVSVANSQGNIDVDPGQFGHVTDENTSPEYVEELPETMVVVKPKTNEEKKPETITPEQEMVAIAISQSEDDSPREVVKELIEAEIPTKTIVSGAVAVGVDSGDTIEQIIDVVPDAVPVIEKLIEDIPDQAGNIITIGVARNKLDVKQIPTVVPKSDTDKEQLKSSIALGKLIAPPKQPEEEKRKKDTEPSDGKPEEVKENRQPGERHAAPEHVPVEPQLIPGANGGGEPASPS